MQIVIILILISLLTDCTCRVNTKVDSRNRKQEVVDQSYVPAMGDRVKVKDDFYRKCKMYIIDRLPDGKYLLKVSCSWQKSNEMIVDRNEILEEDPY